MMAHCLLDPEEKRVSETSIEIQISPFKRKRLNIKSVNWEMGTWKLSGHSARFS